MSQIGISTNVAHPGPRLGGPRRGDGDGDVREAGAAPDRGLRVQAGPQYRSGNGL